MCVASLTAWVKFGPAQVAAVICPSNESLPHDSWGEEEAMPRRRQPTARQERLGIELRKLREAAGLKAREAAALVGSDSAQMSQMESGIAGVSEERVRRLAAHYACTDDELIEALVAMATDRTRGWWEKYRGLLPMPFLDLAELDYHATYRYNVEFLYVPGLLQTEDYARAIFSYRVPEPPYGELELRVRHRMDRKVVIEGPTPSRTKR